MSSENGRICPDTHGTAVYIASLAEELALLAKRNDRDMLAYILEMARLEADQISKSCTALPESPPRP
jgi:hypothetical protein